MEFSLSAPSESSSSADIVPQLIEEARRGSQSALGQLIERHRRYLQIVSAREIPPQLQAKVSPSDVVQDTFVEACQDFLDFGGRTRFELRAWLRRILVNNLADLARHYEDTAKRQISREVRLTGQEEANGHSPAGMATWETPSMHAICNEATQQLEHVMAELPEDYQQVILLRNRDRLTFPEVGAQMHRSADAARKLWATAIVRLQERLEEFDARR